MTIDIRKHTGEDTGRKIELVSDVFQMEPNDHAIYLDVKNFLANQRQGTGSSKERSDVKGSSRKIKKQKGTGSARAGNIRNPLYRGGGRVFGPHPRDYSFKLNKKLKNLARKSALTYKAKDNAVAVLEDFDFGTPKTKEYINLMSTLSLGDRKTLLVLSQYQKNLILSSRNIQKAKVITVSQLNTYDVLHADNLVLMESAVEKLNQWLIKTTDQ